MEEVELEAIFDDKYRNDELFRMKLKECFRDRSMLDSQLRLKYSNIKGHNLRKYRKYLYMDLWVKDESFRHDVNEYDLENVKKPILRVEYIYIITNKVFKDNIKIGKTIDPIKRLSNYNVGDPNKNYQYVFLKETSVADVIEKYFKNKYSSNNEWYSLSIEEASNKILNIIEVLED